LDTIPYSTTRFKSVPALTADLSRCQMPQGFCGRFKNKRQRLEFAAFSGIEIRRTLFLARIGLS